MKYQVVYFTRTGNSKRVAEKIAAKISSMAIEITDNMNWSGIIGFIKGGYYASKNKDVKIKISKEIEDFDELIVVSPLWAGRLAPAITAFLKTVSQGKVHLVITSGGSTLQNCTGYKSVSSIVKNKNNEDETINSLIQRLV